MVLQDDDVGAGSPTLMEGAGGTVAEVFTLSAEGVDDRSSMDGCTAQELARAASAEPSCVGSAKSPANQMLEVPDEWKMSLLGPMLEDYYFTCDQLATIATSFADRENREEAVLKGFGTLTDPENLHQLLAVLPDAQADSIKVRPYVCQLNMHPLLHIRMHTHLGARMQVFHCD